MAISVHWPSGVITVNKADMTEITPNVLYELDVNAFRLELKALEDAADEGMPWPRTHNQLTSTYDISGITYDRAIQIIPPYTVEFEDGQYVVNTTGANHNIADRLVANQVSVITNNAAGRTVVAANPSALDIADAVWDEPTADHTASGTFGLLVDRIKKFVQAGL